MKKIKKLSLILLSMSALISVVSCDLSTSTSEVNTTDETKPSNTNPSNTDSTDTDSTDTDPVVNKYTVTFNTNGGTSIQAQTVESGKTISAVSTAKTGFTFGGWFTDPEFKNSFNVNTPINSDLNLYAKWNSTITTYTVTFITNGGTSIQAQTVESGKTIPAVSTARDGFTFEGWFTDPDFNNSFNVNTPVGGNLYLYAKWKSTTLTTVILNSAGYNEGAYVSFAVKNETYAKNSTVSYSIEGTSWTAIDKDLIIYDSSSNTATAYVVGLKAGNYQLKVNNGENEDTTSYLNVSSEDRSGYAHFNRTEGVGAYNNDGTLKSNAEKIYVTEENKNTVTANGNTGIANILKNQSKSSKPLDIRIIGTIGAAMWASPKYPTSSYSSATNTTIRGNNDSYLELKTYEESDLLNKFNVLDESKYSKLNNLSNKIKYDSSKSEFDSYYNMLDISNADNVTIEGIGTDATIAQWGFTWKSCNSIEIKNLTFKDYPEDACAFEGSVSDLAKGTTSLDLDVFASSNYWIHNNTFNIGKNNWDVCKEHDKGDGDGSTDIKKVKNATYSYNKYVGTHKTGLVGGSEKHVTANLTFHHNYYVGCKSRMPYARQANMHMYNNYYDSSTGTTMQIYAGAYAFVENCYFKNDKKTFEFNNKDYTAPAVKSYNNIFNGSKTYDNANIVTDRAAKVSNGNIFNQNFDTDSSFFYYDSINKKSIVERMDDPNTLPTLLPTISGAGLLPNLNLSSSSTDPVEPATPDVTKYTVTFNTNGGSSIQSQSVEAGKTISSVSTTKSGYKFVGWYTDSKFENEFNVNTPINADTELFAKWEEKTTNGNTLTLEIPTETGKKIESFTAGDFTVTATSDKYVTVSNGVIQLNGGGNKEYRSIVANVGTTDEITITIDVTGGSNKRYLVVADSNGNSLSKTEVTGNTLIINVSGSSTYYIYSESNGLNVYSLTITG